MLGTPASWDRIQEGLDSPWRLRRAIAAVVLTPVWRALLIAGGVRVGKGARFYGFPQVRRFAGSTIELGANVVLRSWPGSNVLGLAHGVMLTTMARGALISIGDGVGLSGTTVAAAKRVIIGSGTLIGADVLITDNDHHAVGGDLYATGLEGVDSAPVEIGERVFIGARVLILKGVHIGSHAVVGAGAVVASSVPSRAVVAGNPARVIGSVANPADVQHSPPAGGL